MISLKSAFVFLLFQSCVNGFRPALFRRERYLPSLNLFAEQAQVESKSETTSLDLIQSLSENAIQARGTVTGLEDMLKLSELCAERVPFDFASVSDQRGDEQSVISKLPGLLPSSVTKQIFEKVEVMLQKGWLSTNPDSVDGLPSFHLNLVSNGKPIASGDNLDEFQIEIQSMLDLVGPHVYDKLLPHVNEQLGTDTIEVSDIFIRRYGQDMLDGKSRNGISAHYDVFSRVTSVAALDNVARDGRNGLYTTAKDISANGGTMTSNHAALRRFFPLSCGDAVVHTWDVLHGVDVEEGIDRTSLIVWFTEKTSGDDKSVSPWLQNRPHLDKDNVAQFVLASAVESIEPPAPTLGSSSGRTSQSMHQGIGADKEEVGGLQKSIDLYLSSASKGNSFAMARLGSLLEEGSLNDTRALDKAREVLEGLLKGRATDCPTWVVCNDGDDNMTLARQFWYEASLRGNALAQIALADEIMASATHEPDARLTAATLFGLAAQQGNEQAVESLARLVQVDVQYSAIASQEEFEAAPVMQVARVATMYL